MRLLAISLLALVAAGCTSRNPRYCDENTPCDDPDHPEQTFCDLTGDHNPDGVTNRCVEPLFDAGVICHSSDECEAETSPICDDAAAICRGCDYGGAGASECAAKDPVNEYCSADGSCVSGCGDSDECPGDAPICSATHRCEVCDDDGTGDVDCAARDAATPRCKSDGTCVGCIDPEDCGGTTPVCDGETNTCRACEANADCDSEVCERASGACAASDDVVYVAQTGGTDGPGCGSSESPCATIAGAQGGLAKVGGSRIYVLVRTGTYLESVAVTEGQTVVLIGNAAIVAPPIYHPGLLVSNGSTVTAETIEFADATGNAEADGVRCAGSASSLTLFRVTVKDNKAIGVESDDCSVRIERCLIIGNKGGGIDLENLGFSIANNIIANNGDAGVTNFGGVRISNAGSFTPQEFNFNTVVKNQAYGPGSADSSGVDCYTSTSMTAANSIVQDGIGGAPATHGNCSWEYSDVDGIAQSNGNFDAEPQFKDLLGGDFHLEPTSPCRDKADPAATLDIDYDGQARPEPVDGRSDVGADEIYP